MKTQLAKPFGKNVRPDFATNTLEPKEQGLSFLKKMGAISFKEAQNDELLVNQKEEGLDIKS